MSITLKTLQDGLKVILDEHLAAMKEDVKAEVLPFYDPITMEGARYAQAAAMGDPQAQANLQHLAAQLALLAAVLTKKEESRLALTIENVVMGAVKYGGILLKAALV